MYLKSLSFLTLLFCFCVQTPSVLGQKSKNLQAMNNSGQLFIIGGGEKTKALMTDLLKVAGVGSSDYVIILPMSSEEPDSSILYAKQDFAAAGIANVVGFNFIEHGPIEQSKLDSIQKAKLVYITGGDQTRFMKIVKNGPIYTAIHNAYKNGSTIAGTSAGAAVMSKKMITGNSLKYPEYTGEYPVLESENIEINEGLGLLENIIVDQHFIKRQRMNRLLAVALENPAELCVGIDESTAIIVSGNSFKVTGENQVIVLSNPKKDKKIKSNLLGGKGLIIDILLPGESYKMSNSNLK